MPKTVRSAELKIGISTGYPSYYYQTGTTHDGLCIRIVNAVAEKLNSRVTYREFPWKRLLLSAQNGIVDAIMPLFKTEPRKKYLYFKGLGLAYETTYFFTRRDRPIEYHGRFEELEQYSIGVVSEYSYGSRFDAYHGFARVVTKNDRHLLEVFHHNRSDVGVGNSHTVRFYAKQIGITDNIRFLEPPVTSNMLFLGFSRKKNQPSLWRGFAAALKAFKQSAEYRAIATTYQMPTPP